MRLIGIHTCNNDPIMKTRHLYHDRGSGWRLYMPDLVQHVLLKNSLNKTEEKRWNVIHSANREIHKSLRDGIMDFPCPECGEKMVVIPNSNFYNSNKYLGYRWVCSDPECDTHIGCHANTYVPLGNPARLSTREARRECHKLFDVLWKTAGFSRKGAYNWLANRLHIPVYLCHVAMFDEDQCTEAVRILRAFIGKMNKRKD